MVDDRFAWRLRWALGHLLAVGLVALFVTLGIWQLRRLDERRATNELIEARAQMDPVPVGQLLDPGDGGDVVDQARFRAVTASGSYLDVDAAVRVSQGGASGARVFTVLDVGSGETVAVLRGFAAQRSDGQVIAPDPPPGAATVAGVAVPRSRLEPISRRAIDDLEASAPGLLPVVIQATEPDVEALAAVPPPELGDGPHLSYAVQWFLFAGVGAIGYPMLLRRRSGAGGP